MAELTGDELKAKLATEDQLDKIIAAINPKKYSSNPKAVMALLKKGNFWQAVKESKPVPAAQHKLVYDSLAEQLEPIYFWILDFMNGMFGGKVEKLIDNFSSSPGSGHFGEMGIRKSQMQQQASTVLATINSVLKSVINLLYDLREFKMRLEHYNAAKSKDANKKDAGILALKQIWMDKVDILRGNGSMNAMSSGQLQFVTLRDAFMKINNVDEADKLDLNDRVRRVLKPRIHEFLVWKQTSEGELRKRFEIEKTYLKSQVAALKLQARWAKPYLKAAQQLENSENLSTNAALVNAFNMMMLNLTILGKSGVDVEEAVIAKDLPHDFKKMKKLRTYHAIVSVNFSFRGVPSKAGQHYTFGGRSDVVFNAYALNDDELSLLKKKLSESDLNSSLNLVQGMTEDSLAQLKVDLEEFLGEEDKEEEKEKTEDSNPFLALFSFLKPGSKEEKKEKEKAKSKAKSKKGIKTDNYAEKYLRNFAEADAITRCYTVFDIYKKAHGMASLPYMESSEPRPPRSQAERAFGFGRDNKVD
jgi:hypothetical protein